MYLIVDSEDDIYIIARVEKYLKFKIKLYYEEYIVLYFPKKFSIDEKVVIICQTQ
jgi:hypothetical protein